MQYGQRVIVENSVGCCATNSGKHIIDIGDTDADSRVWCIQCSDFVGVVGQDIQLTLVDKNLLKYDCRKV